MANTTSNYTIVDVSSICQVVFAQTPTELLHGVRSKAVQRPSSVEARRKGLGGQDVRRVAAADLMKERRR